MEWVKYAGVDHFYSEAGLEAELGTWTLQKCYFWHFVKRFWIPKLPFFERAPTSARKSRFFQRHACRMCVPNAQLWKNSNAFPSPRPRSPRWRAWAPRGSRWRRPPQSGSSRWSGGSSCSIWGWPISVFYSRCLNIWSMKLVKKVYLIVSSFWRKPKCLLIVP